MNKFLVLSSQFIVVISLFLLLPTTNYQLLTTFAADATPSSDIKSKLEELKKEIASKAAKLKQEVNNKLKDKSYTGQVKTVSSTSITLAGKTGPKIVSLNQDTVYESSVKTKTKFSQKSISEEDYIAALGDIDEQGVLIAKKVILLPITNSEPKTSLWGQIISVSDKLITLKDRSLKNHAVTISGSNQVEINDFVILTGTTGKNDIFKAGFVYVIPQGGFIKPKKTASPSASLKPSPALKTK